MIVCQCTKKTGFSPIMAYFRLLTLTEFFNLPVGGITQEFIAKRYGVVNTIIRIGHPRIIGIPTQISKSTHFFASQPGVDHLVGATFLHIEVTAHIVVTEVTVEVFISAAFFLSGNDERHIKFS